MKSLLALVAFFATAVAAHAAPKVDPRLAAAVAASPSAPQGAVITYQVKPGAPEFGRLSAAGVVNGATLRELPMVLTTINASQLAAIKMQPGIVSIYGNHAYPLLTNSSRKFIGQEALLRDREATAANGGLPVAGQGVGVAVIDTGIDATHNDLKLGVNVAQNVLFPLAEASAVEIGPGFAPPVAVENAPISDVEGGHGTFVSGAVGATGASSGNFYGGVAPGADLIGLVAGNDAGLTTFAIVQAYDWILVNQYRYNIRVANNSFGELIGSAANYDAFDPINVGSRALHDRFIAVVFAAGNDGSVPGAINRLAVSPWVISVAAGEKEGFGSPATFSSRGIDDGGPVEASGHPADPNDPPNLRPDITGPGSNIVSTRSKGPGVTNVAGTALTQDLDVAPAFLPFYTTSQGTSFSAPHVAGVLALMFDANPQLTPQQAKLILRRTATPMPFPQRIVGSGYVDAHNAVRAAFNLAAVAHPADLIPAPGSPEVLDVANDQIGTGANDILTASFVYDAAAGQLVYTMNVADLGDTSAQSRWTMQSNFGATTIFISASRDELGTPAFEYGRITALANGTPNQETLGAADSGVIDVAANRIVMRLGVDKINAALGTDVVGTTSTDGEARTQILIGTSFTGGLLLNADDGSSRDFTLGGSNGGSGGGEGTGPSCADGGSIDRFAGAVAAGAAHESVSFTNACAAAEAKLTYHPGNAGLTLVLLNAAGAEVARANAANGKQIRRTPLAKGDYRLRIEGSPSKAVDYVIEVRQSD